MSAVAKFTRDAPCTKVHLWNCFGGEGPVPVVDAKAIVGENAPKYLLREKYITQTSRAGVDYYSITKDGREWLTTGVRRYLALHPEDAAFLTREVPGMNTNKAGTSSATRVIRRVRR